MEDGLVDLSLFAESPTNDHHFAVARIPSFYDLHEDLSWSHHNRGAYQPTPAASTMKPLPPLPRRCFIEVGLDPRRFDEPSRCILSRLKRSLSDYHTDLSVHPTNTIQQRRQVAPTPQLTLTAPAQHSVRGRPASPMVWMPDEQMWLIVDEEGFSHHRSATFPTSSTYDSPRYARSEPSPRQRDSDFSPVRTQFMRLIPPRSDDDRLSPLFQEAINGVSLYEYGDSNEPPTFQADRDWRVETPRWDSWQSEISDISPVSGSHTRDVSQWEDFGFSTRRPSTAS
ncbi:hypothetical protein MMC34_000835 [Xylographa carneopallida]|nr:hypothetical protein [Xylographa carneopallida]